MVIRAPKEARNQVVDVEIARFLPRAAVSTAKPIPLEDC
jgi:hypothetical protein